MFDLEKVKAKFNQFLSNETVPPIVKNGSEYYVFKYYTIKNGDGKYDLYKKDDYVDTVQSSAAAISWCKADLDNRWTLAKDIIKADQRITTTNIDLQIRRHRYKNEKDKEIRETLAILINESIYKLQSQKRNLKKLIKQTKYIKIKGFDNELN
jgi:flagellar motility protein MotE (MotC chaperone)